jgi:DegV family protein with EDD domain
MTSSCILTDSSVQFSFPGFPGNKCLRILEHHLAYSSAEKTFDILPKVSELPSYSSAEFSPKIIAPTPEDIVSTLSDILPFYDDIFILLLSKEISPLFGEVEKIMASLHGHADLHLIDSQNTSLGLGLLVQYTAELTSKNIPPDEIEKSLRLLIPHIYTLFCTPNLSYLHASAVLDMGQSTVGEMLGLYPMFVMEEGRLNPLQKVKNQRAAIDYCIEFVNEFDDLKHVAFIQPTAPVINETKLLHQHLEETFPSTSYTEHIISPFLSSLFGPRGFGMVVMENIEVSS